MIHERSTQNLSLLADWLKLASTLHFITPIDGRHHWIMQWLSSLLYSGRLPQGWATDHSGKFIMVALQNCLELDHFWFQIRLLRSSQIPARSIITLWTTSSTSWEKISNKTSVREVKCCNLSRTICHKPDFVQHWTLQAHWKKRCRSDSTWNPQTSHPSGHCTYVYVSASRCCIGKTLLQICHMKLRIRGGILGCQILFHSPPRQLSIAILPLLTACL